MEITIPDPVKLRETPLQLLRYRVDHVEHAVGELQEAITIMDGSLRPLSLATLKIKQAVSELMKSKDEHDPPLDQ